MARTKDPALEEARRAQIADATIALLAEGDWRGVSLSAVAARAGVSKGVVTYWYDSKEALLLSAIERFHARYAERLMSVAAEAVPARERLRCLLAVAFPSQAEVVEELRFQVELVSYAKEHPAVAEALRGSYADFRVACEALLTMGVAEGYITRPSEGLYRFIHALIDGLSMQLLIDDDVDMEALRERVLELLELWLTRPG